MNGPFKGRRSFGTDLAWVTGSLIVTMTLVVALLDAVGFFEFAQANATDKVVAAAIAVVGTFFTVVASLVSLAWKSTIEERNLVLKEQAEERLKIDNDRNAALEKSADEREHFEAVMKALELFKIETSEKYLRYDVAGALLTLSSLKEHLLALHLLAALWPRKVVDARIAMNVLQPAWEAGFAKTVTRILAENAAQCRINGLFTKPTALNDWPADEHLEVRDNATEFYLRVIMAWPRPTCLGPTFCEVGKDLMEVCVHDSSSAIRNQAIDGLRILAKATPVIGTISTRHGPLTLDDMVKRAERAIAETDAHDPMLFRPLLREALNDLRAWAKNDQPDTVSSTPQ